MLVEMLIVVAITGIVITSGVALLVYTVRLLAEAQRDFKESGAERTAVNRLFSDVREMALLHVGTTRSGDVVPAPDHHVTIR